MVGKVFSNRQNKNQLHPFRGLEVNAAWQLDPAACTQVLLTKDQDRHQRCQRRDVKPMHAFQQHVIVQKTYDEHAGQPAKNPVHLFYVHPRELAVLGRAVDFNHAERADDEHECQQRPIKIAV